MTRALIAVGAALALLIGVLVVAVVVTREKEGIGVDTPLAERIARAAALTDRIDLPELAPFAWDEVLIVARDTPPEAISAELGREWTGDGTLTAGELLIFLDRGRVARFADYRGAGTFAGFDEPFDRIPRREATLRVRDLVISPDGGPSG